MSLLYQHQFTSFLIILVRWKDAAKITTSHSGPIPPRIRPSPFSRRAGGDTSAFGLVGSEDAPHWLGYLGIPLHFTFFDMMG